ncbi:hypothetical protein Tco_1126611 [Tanacetum coccineum]
MYNLGVIIAYLETPLLVSPLDDDAEDARNAYVKFFNEQLEVACIMLANLNLELQKNLEIYNAYDMFEELKTMFQHQAGQELLEKVKAFHACKQKVGQSINAHVWKMKGFLDQLKRLGFPMPPVFGMNLILTSLSKDYHAFVMIYNMYSMGKTDAGLVNSQRFASPNSIALSHFEMSCCQAADDLTVQHIMRTQALEAGARVDTLEDTGSSS